jgi:nitrite reductase/ring-hydroxylating ferredoxin subunit/alkylhydroperoxidase/carboxymuconolactone decarboxylase family protein YurZ
MSDSLEYLAKVRPEAAGHYLKFLKECGRHLDDKTRFLISVVTKVACGTERGFKQYLPRALEAGATPNEVIDAILSAFPAAGLTNVLKALDVLIEMDLPEFRPENLGRAPSWHEVARLEDLPELKPAYLHADGRHVFVFREKDAFRVYDSHCPHQVTDIPELAIKGKRLTCPRHGWTFDLSTGACIGKGNRPLRSFETKVEEGRLYAHW